jgi:hypothetical protein
MVDSRNGPRAQRQVEPSVRICVLQRTGSGKDEFELDVDAGSRSMLTLRILSCFVSVKQSRVEGGSRAYVGFQGD